MESVSRLASNMTEEEYVNDRLNDQINWYSKKSQANQKWYKNLRMTEIISASLIPFLSGIGDKVAYNAWIIGALGVLIAIATATSSLLKFHENWIQYRTTVEQLKHEKFLYVTNVKPYDSENRFHLLVERVEGLISKENSYWAQSVKQTPKGNQKI